MDLHISILLQELQELKNISKSEYSVPPDPSSIQYFNKRRDNTNSDTLNYMEDFCYKYDIMEIDGRKPKYFNKKDNNEQEAANSLNRVDVKNNVYVGLVMLIKAPTGRYKFDLCNSESDKCVEGGWASSFCFKCNATSSKQVCQVLT